MTARVGSGSGLLGGFVVNQTAVRVVTCTVLRLVGPSGGEEGAKSVAPAPGSGLIGSRLTGSTEFTASISTYPSLKVKRKRSPIPISLGESVARSKTRSPFEDS